METTTVRPAKRFTAVMLLHRVLMLAVLPVLLFLHIVFKILGKTVTSFVRYATSL